MTRRRFFGSGLLGVFGFGHQPKREPAIYQQLTVTMFDGSSYQTVVKLRPGDEVEYTDILNSIKDRGVLSILSHNCAPCDPDGTDSVSLAELKEAVENEWELCE